MKPTEPIVQRQKMIEVAIPLKAINEASAREKSIRHGHPSTMHLWWARRPLAACRAVLFASLVDDPDSDPAYRRSDGTVDEDAAGAKRASLFNLIEELVQWENLNNSRVINAARSEIARCLASRMIELGEMSKDTMILGDNKGQSHPNRAVAGDSVTALDILLMKARPEAVNTFLAEYAPPVLDPFCGGGSIPLEAQRLGLRAYGSDLNPVPVLLTKALVEIPPQFAGRPPVNPEWQSKSEAQKATTVWQGPQGLADDIRYYGLWMRREAEKKLGRLYPTAKITADMVRDRPDLQEYVGKDLTVIAWLWARTVQSPNPAAGGAFVPLVRSFWLSTGKGKEVYVLPIIDRATNTYQFKVMVGPPPDDFNPSVGTVNRSGATCLLTNAPIPFDHVRIHGKDDRLGTRLLGVVAEGRRGRIYLPPISEHEQIAHSVTCDSDILDSALPVQALGFRVQNYGMTKHSQLFSQRQLHALDSFANLVREARQKVFEASHDDSAYANAVATYLAFAVGRGADKWASLTIWNSVGEKIEHVFGRNALSMTWDYPEGNIFSDSTGNWESGVEWVAKAVAAVPTKTLPGHAEQKPAQQISDSHRYMFSTDPPYYDNVPYADLSDFFYVWLRRCLQPFYPDLLGTVLVPKADELVAEPFRHGGREKAMLFFEQGMRQVFERVRATTRPDFPATIYYAFKQAESNGQDDGDSSDAYGNAGSRSSTGWETFLQGLLDAGWQICGTWPLRTERAARLRGQLSNALASSIVLVCRPRPAEATITSRNGFLHELRRELPESLRNLQHSNIAPVDLAQAAIGPGMAIFTRYEKIVESDGSSMTVRTALGIINQVLDEVLAEQEGEFDNDTRWALAWFEQFGTQEEAYGVAETLSTAKNTAITRLVEAGIVKAKSGRVQLISRAELPESWDPTSDKRLTAWEITQHLIRTLETEGEAKAAALLNKLGSTSESARDLAYRLYSICERKKWADEALAYNSLVIAWPEISKLALSSRNRQTSTQHNLFS
jgi:putative DNA methylase